MSLKQRSALIHIFKMSDSAKKKAKHLTTVMKIRREHSASFGALMQTLSIHCVCVDLVIFSKLPPGETDGTKKWSYSKMETGEYNRTKPQQHVSFRLFWSFLAANTQMLQWQFMRGDWGHWYSKAETVEFHATAARAKGATRDANVSVFWDHS